MSTLPFPFKPRPTKGLLGSIRTCRGGLFAVLPSPNITVCLPVFGRCFMNQPRERKPVYLVSMLRINRVLNIYKSPSHTQHEITIPQRIKMVIHQHTQTHTNTYTPTHTRTQTNTHAQKHTHRLTHSRTHDVTEEPSSLFASTFSSLSHVTSSKSRC